MKFAMKPSGWRYDSYRHSLAAKGVKTGTKYFSRKYFADQQTRQQNGPDDFQKTAGTVRDDYASTMDVLKKMARERVAFSDEDLRQGSAAWKDQQALRQVREIATAEQFMRRKLAKVYESIDAGEFDRVTVEEADGTFRDKPFDEVLRSLPAGDYRAAVSQIRRRVTELAKAGIVKDVSDVPANIREYVQTDPTTVSLIKSYSEDRRDAQKSSFLGRAGNTAGTLAVSAVAGTEVLGRAVARGTQGAWASSQEGLQSQPGFFGNEALQVETPGVKNVFFEGYRPGKFSATSTLPDKSEINRLLGIEGGSLFGTSAQDDVLTPNEYVQKEVDELYSARKNLAKIDYDPFEEGEMAFESGDRETLMKAITDLESQEQTLADRWMLAEQSRAQVMNPTNRALAYAEPNKGFFKGLFGEHEAGGGKVIADRTKKINEVKRLLKNSSNELFARRKLLRYKLQRLDSVVPPASDAPKKVKVLQEREPVADWLTVPQQTSPRGVLQDVFANKVAAEDLSQNVPPGV